MQVTVDAVLKHLCRAAPIPAAVAVAVAVVVGKQRSVSMGCTSVAVRGRKARRNGTRLLRETRNLSSTPSYHSHYRCCCCCYCCYHSGLGSMTADSMMLAVAERSRTKTRPRKSTRSRPSQVTNAASQAGLVLKRC